MRDLDVYDGSWVGDDVEKYFWAPAVKISFPDLVAEETKGVSFVERYLAVDVVAATVTSFVADAMSFARGTASFFQLSPL